MTWSNCVIGECQSHTGTIHKQFTVHIPDGKRLVIQPSDTTRRTYTKRFGNGHVSAKKRDLYDSERSKILHELFLPKNGQIENDDCVCFKPSLDPEVSIFQITGFVSVLHTEVAEGILQLRDLISYEKWMSNKYGGTLWARYNNPRFVAVRQMNLEALANGLDPIYKVKDVKKRSVQYKEVDLSKKNKAFSNLLGVMGMLAATDPNIFFPETPLREKESQRIHIPEGNTRKPKRKKVGNHFVFYYPKGK